MAQVNKTRTAAELQNPDLNYFIAYRINVNETDVSKIEDALKKQRNTFASNQTNINNRLVELINDANKVMLEDATVDSSSDSGNPQYIVKNGGRALEAQRAINFSYKNAIEAVNAICGRGYLYDYELDQIARKNEVDFKELHKRVEHLFTQVQYKEIKKIKREIQFAKLIELESLLKTVQKKNIYDFLGLAQSSPVDQLMASRDKIYKAEFGRARNAVSTASITICSIIVNILKTDTSKKEYDIFYRCKEQVFDVLRQYKDMGIKEISDSQVGKFADYMRTATGLSLSEVETELDVYLKENGVVRNSGDAVLQLEVCPYDDCGMSYVVTKGIKTCPNCGKPLEVICWNCNQSTPFTIKHKSCVHCGATKSAETQFNKELTVFNNLLKNKAVTDTELNQAVNRLQNALPGYEKFSNSFIFKKISEAKSRIVQRENERKNAQMIYDKYIKEINSLISVKKYMTAKTVLTKLKIEDSSFDVRDIEKQITDAIGRAQLYATKAQDYAKLNNEAQLVEYAGKALEECADYTTANQILKNYPPKDPTNLIASDRKNVIKLEWTPNGNQKAVTYTIIRKVGSQPVNDEDGTIVESGLTINFYEDSTVAPAVDYYYAVFAERGGIRSKIVKTTSPITLFLDVINVNQVLDEQGIKVTWTVPDNVKSVQVIKKLGSIQPQSANDGIILNNVNLQGFDDNDASSNTISYLIRCVYEINKKNYYSPGRKYTFKTFSIPKLITNFNLVSAFGDEFDLTFDKPVNGNLKLYVFDKRVEMNFGTPLSHTDFQSRGKFLKEIEFVVLSENKINFTVPSNAVTWLYPVNSNDELCIVMEPLVLNTIIGLENMNLIEKNESIIIEGTLSNNVRNLIAKISDTAFPQSMDDKCDQRVCSKDTFDRDNGFIIKLGEGLHYITLFAEISEGGKKGYSRPISLPNPVGKVRKSIVKFAPHYQPNVKKTYKATIVFYSDEEITLPEILVVKGDKKAFSKSEGVKVAVIKSMTLKSKFLKKGFWGKAEIKVDSAHNMKEKLSFFINDDYNKTILLKEVKDL